MPSDNLTKCRASGWHNNCGLNCLTHFIAINIDDPQTREQYGGIVGYQNLLTAFAKYYKLPPTTTWEDVNNILKKFPEPSDREAIFSPVLRQQLGEFMVSPKLTHEGK